MNIHSTDLIYGIPEVISGSELSELDMLALASKNFPNKEHCTLWRWMIIDILVMEPELSKIKANGQKPIVVYAQPIEGNSSCSDYQVSFNGNIFETHDMVYILMGEGFRTTANAKLFSLLEK